MVKCSKCKKRYAVYPKKKSSRKIYWIEGDKIFDSAKEAALFFDCSIINVYKALEDQNEISANAKIEYENKLAKLEKQLNKAFDYCLRFGKYKGNTIPFVQNMEPSYLDWVLKQGWVNEKIKSYINTVRQYLQNMHS